MASADGAPGRPRRRRRRLLRLVLAGVALFVSGLVAVLVGLYVVGDRSLDRIEVDGIEEADGGGGDASGPDIEELDDVLHVLIVGSDRRDGLTEEQRDELGTGVADGDRTDTIMLARLDPGTEEVAVLSFPRDLLVTRCDGSRGKINAAYGIGERSGVGGASCLVRTITDMSGLSIQHFVQVDFAGFLDLVDLVDGVTVYLEEPITDPLAQLDLDTGCHRLRGAEALGFVRHRASDSDYGRIARQQRFVKELLREAGRASNVLNLPRLFQMVGAGAGAVTTDQTLTLDKMRRIAFTLRDLGPDDLVARTVPADHRRISGIDYEIPRDEEAEQLYEAFTAGRLGAEPVDPGSGGSDPDGGEPGPDGAEPGPGEEPAAGSGGPAPPPPPEAEYVGAQEPPASCR